MVAGVVSMAGFRGQRSRASRPCEVFPDMKRQPRLRPQKPSDFFADRRSSRLPVGDHRRGDALRGYAAQHRAAMPGTTNWVAVIRCRSPRNCWPADASASRSFAAPCHGEAGDGNGITTKYGMLKAGNFHDPRLVRMPDGEIFKIDHPGQGT